MLGEVAGDNAGVLVDSPPLGAHRHVVPAGLSWTKQFLSGGTKNNRQRRSAFAFKGGKRVAFSRTNKWGINGDFFYINSSQVALLFVRDMPK